MAAEPNVYSRRWHETFHRWHDPERTLIEVDFLTRWLPLGSVLDVCCGYGRHALGLAARGYDVVGVERDPEIAADARSRGLDVRELDMRDLDDLDGSFDSVICMWSSFGMFDEAENERLLGVLPGKLRPGGRLVLDVPDRAFFLAQPRMREVRPGIQETRSVEGRRLRIQLDYGAGASDAFDWEAFAADELSAAAARHGLRCVVACGGFDETVAPNGQTPRMQLVFER